MQLPDLRRDFAFNRIKLKKSYPMALTQMLIKLAHMYFQPKNPTQT